MEGCRRPRAQSGAPRLTPTPMIACRRKLGEPRSQTAPMTASDRESRAGEAISQFRLFRTGLCGLETQALVTKRPWDSLGIGEVGRQMRRSFVLSVIEGPQLTIFPLLYPRRESCVLRKLIPVPDGSPSTPPTSLEGEDPVGVLPRWGVVSPRLPDPTPVRTFVQ